MSSTAATLILGLALCALITAEKVSTLQQPTSDWKGYQANLDVVRNMVQSDLGYLYRTMSIRKETTVESVSISLGLKENKRPNRLSSWSLFTSEVDENGAVRPKNRNPTAMWPWNNRLEPQAGGHGAAQGQVVFEWAVLADAQKIVSFETPTNIMIPVGTQNDFWTYYTMDTSARINCDFASKHGRPEGWTPYWQAAYNAAAGTTMGEKAKAYLKVQKDNGASWVFNSMLCDKDQHADNTTSFAAHGSGAMLKKLLQQVLHGDYKFPEGKDRHNEILVKDMMMKDDEESMQTKDFIKAMVLPYGSDLLDRVDVEAKVEMLWKGLSGLEVSWWTFGGSHLNQDGKPGKMMSILDEHNPACSKGDGSEETIKACCENSDRGVKAYCEVLSKKGYHLSSVPLFTV